MRLREILICLAVWREKFHSGELNMKEMRCQIKRHQSEFNELVEEFESKKSAVERMKDKVQSRIESDLFQKWTRWHTL